MVFYVYFDPHVISAAEASGAYALQCLVGILRGFEANCLIAEFDDYFVQGELKDRVDGLTDDDTRKFLKSLFATLEKRNRFIYVLASRASPAEKRAADALLQGKQAELGFILAENAGIHPNPHNIPICGLQTYHTTSFEQERNAAATGGRTFAASTYAEQKFLDWSLRKAIKHCSVIHVYDKLFGTRFRGNFDYSAKAFIRWLETFVAEPDQVALHIHCGLPDGKTDHFIQHQLSLSRRGRLAKMPLTLQFYRIEDGEDLPHERYLITRQFAIDLGRGLDFLDPTTQMNRAGRFSFAGSRELERALNALPLPKLPVVSF